MKPKDPIPTLKKTGVVYRVPCKDCDVQYTYIGETGRALGTRRIEHERAVRLEKTEKSALAEHGGTWPFNCVERVKRDLQ